MCVKEDQAIEECNGAGLVGGKKYFQPIKWKIYQIWLAMKLYFSVFHWIGQLWVRYFLEAGSERKMASILWFERYPWNLMNYSINEYNNIGLDSLALSLSMKWFFAENQECLGIFLFLLWSLMSFVQDVIRNVSSRYITRQPVLCGSCLLQKKMLEIAECAWRLWDAHQH